MDVKAEILKLLADGREMRSFDIRQALKDQGMWFVDVRMWPALRELEGAGRLRMRETPGGPERGYRPNFFFKIK